MFFFRTQINKFTSKFLCSNSIYNGSELSICLDLEIKLIVSVKLSEPVFILLQRFK